MHRMRGKGQFCNLQRSAITSHHSLPTGALRQHQCPHLGIHSGNALLAHGKLAPLNKFRFRFPFPLFPHSVFSSCPARKEASVSPVSRYVVIEDLHGVFVLFRLLNDHSVVQLVTGRVQSMLANARMLGNIELACLRAVAGQDGRLLCPL